MKNVSRNNFVYLIGEKTRIFHLRPKLKYYQRHIKKQIKFGNHLRLKNTFAHYYTSAPNTDKDLQGPA